MQAVAAVGDGDGAFDDHQNMRIDPHHVLNGVLHRGGVEELTHVVVVGGHGDNHQFLGHISNYSISFSKEFSSAKPSVIESNSIFKRVT